MSPGEWSAGTPWTEPENPVHIVLAVTVLLAAAGLVIWLVYVLGVDAPALSWLALLILVAVAVLGFTMSARWWADRQREPRPQTPEQHLPVAVVGLHGLLGAITLVLVALVAFGVA